MKTANVIVSASSAHRSHRPDRLGQIAGVLPTAVGERERLDRLVHVPLGVPDRVGVLLAREQIAARALDQFEDAVAVGWRRHR